MIAIILIPPLYISLFLALIFAVSKVYYTINIQHPEITGGLHFEFINITQAISILTGLTIITAMLTSAIISFIKDALKCR